MERVKYHEAIETLKERDPDFALLIVECIDMMETKVFMRPLTEDEKMIAYSSYLTGLFYSKMEQEVVGSSTPHVPSMN